MQVLFLRLISKIFLDFLEQLEEPRLIEWFDIYSLQQTFVAKLGVLN